MDQVLRGLPFTFTYIDDILIASEDEETHKIHLKETLQRLNAQGITTNLEKCHIGKKEIDFLGYTVNAEGIRPKSDKVKAIKEYPKPGNVQELRRFL